MWYVASCYGNHQVYSCGVVDVYFSGEYINYVTYRLVVIGEILGR